MSDALNSTFKAKKIKLKSKKEGIFSVGRHQIHHGDCLATLDGMASDSIDVVVTSPPYNIDIEYNSYSDTKSEDDYLIWIEQIAQSLKRVMKSDGSFFLNITGSNRKPWLPFMLAARMRGIFELQNHFVWVKSIAVDRESSGHFKPISGARFTHHNHEHIFHFTKTGSVPLDRLSIGVPFKDKSNISRFSHGSDLRCRGNTWYIPYKTVNNKEKKYLHPATFPFELPLWCIFLHGVENARVLDPFLGSGSTLIAAEHAGCRGVGIEIDDTYVRTAVGRITNEVNTAMHVTLNSTEMNILLKQGAETKADGGFQGLMVSLQERLNKTTGDLTLTESDLIRIPKYAFDYKNGGWEDRLIGIFSRSLGPNLGR